VSDAEDDGLSDRGDVDDEDDDDEESEPDVWRCECCRKDFKSRGQMENHLGSKKHKQALKAYQAELQELQ
jgi:DnaJ family protein A protein 5